jgi:hypothetical protein
MNFVAIGFGNQAILSEKFDYIYECQEYVKVAKSRLVSNFISADCSYKRAQLEVGGEVFTK